ncbi:MAG: hypothetical protein M1823_001092 [Watsoniomyces obsoletus]|nr:MAG: hypothetical protein M1823_001092 [Watsoniomyces obsoletus]
MSTVRRRNVTPPPSDPPSPSSNTSPSSKLADEDQVRISFLDILRILGGLILLSSILSYFILDNSLTWNYRPRWTRPSIIKSYLRGPIQLTPQELSLYNGTDPKIPIYLAINGSIYDVSASPSFYGPGGSYHFFAGKEGTRAFVTGCFEEDITPDLRDVEEMFIPIYAREDVEAASGAERKKRREQDERIARKKVLEAVKHWEDFFEKNDRYFKVGRVKREEGWLEKLPRRELCETAREARPTREYGT